MPESSWLNNEKILELRFRLSLLLNFFPKLYLVPFTPFSGHKQMEENWELKEIVPWLCAPVIVTHCPSATARMD